MEGAVQRLLYRQNAEPTVMRFAGNTLSMVLNITLVVAILGYFGVQTTTFAALIAALGLAHGCPNETTNAHMQWELWMAC